MDTLSRLVVMTLSELQGVPEHRSGGLHRIIIAAIFAALAVVVAAGALGCAVAAFWIYLESAHGAVSAALGSMLLLFLLSIVLLILAAVLLQDGQPPRSVGSALGDDLRQEIQRGLMRNKGAVLLAALIAGIAAGTTTRPK